MAVTEQAVVAGNAGQPAAPDGAAGASHAPPPLPADRRARSRAALRDRVYDAALELFVRQGFANTTMDEIAEAADVARATVFNHFQRKTAFLDEWSSRRRQRALAAVRAEHLESHTLRETLDRYMVELARVSVSTREETVALMGAAIHATDVLSNPQLARELGALMSSAQDSGQLRDDLDPQHAGLLAATGYFAMLSRWIAVEPAPFDLQAALLQMVDLLFRGLLPPAA